MPEAEQATRRIPASYVVYTALGPLLAVYAIVWAVLLMGVPGVMDNKRLFWTQFSITVGGVILAAATQSIVLVRLTRDFSRGRRRTILIVVNLLLLCAACAVLAWVGWALHAFRQYLF